MKRDNTIAIDNDGVIFDLMTNWLRRNNVKYNDNLKPEDILEWGIHKFVKPECGMKIYDFLEDPSIYDDVLPIKGAVEGIRKLRMLAYDIMFVTHATVGHAGRKLKLLKEYNIFYDDDIYLEREDKSDVEARWLIDDYIKNVSSFKGTGILYTQPYNVDSPITPRVNNWDDIVRYFTKQRRGY